MTNGFIVDGLAAFDLTENSLLPTQATGTLFTGSDGVYEYVKASGAVTAGWFVVIDTGVAAALTTTNAGSVAKGIGVACVDLTDTYYGWVWRGAGINTGIVTNAAAAANLTSTAAPGIAGVGGTTIIGARNTAAGVTATRVGIYASTLMAVNT